MKKKQRLNVLFVAILLCSPWAVAKKNEQSLPTALYKPNDYAQYLDLTNKQYWKLFSAMQLHHETKTGFKFEPIRNKNAFIELSNLMEAGQDVPLKLQTEVRSLFQNNFNNLADFIEVPRTRIQGIVNNYSKMANVVNQLETIRLARQKTQLLTKKRVTKSIVVTASGDSIFKESSLNAMQIWKQGAELGENSQLLVNVSFVSLGSNTTFGTQEWIVNRFWAVPIESVVCISSECNLFYL